MTAPAMNDTTRRHPRTLVQAFPESEGYREAFDGPHHPHALRDLVAAGLRWAWRLIQWACVLLVLLGAWGLATRPTAVPTASPIAVPQPPIVRPTT